MQTGLIRSGRGIAAMALLSSVWALASRPAPAAAAERGESAHGRVVGAVAERVTRSVPAEQVLTLEARDVPALLTPDERRALSTGHVTFRINAPAVVSVIRPTAADPDPFWLADRGFERTPLTLEAGDKPYDVWERRFDAGVVSLGVGPFSARVYPYFVAVKPVDARVELEVTDLSPRRLKLDTLANGVKPLVDREIELTDVPPALAGRMLVRTSRAWSRDLALLDRFLRTKYPSSSEPDHVLLTWSGDPRTTITVQWRTGPTLTGGAVRYREVRADGSAAPARQIAAHTRPLSTPNVVNDPLIHLHAATLEGLRPGTAYEYNVGTGTGGGWTAWREFTTAPDEPASFSFTYMGDAQVGLDRWGGLLREAFRAHPDSAFYILAGDLVDRGHDRDDWDAFLHHAAGVLDRRAFVPVLGNHEVLGGKPPALYLSFFRLPQNGPASIEPGRAYAFEYGNALFVVLDSNLDPERQTSWLEAQLAGSAATWKFVSFHHPVYASHPDRNHEHLLRAWGPVFDRHGVDMVLQGHDHAYLRTHPMRGGKPSVDKRGTYYVVSVSGTKFYEQADHDYTAVGFEEVSTYQVIRVEVGADRLRYRAFDAEGTVRDELAITKPAATRPAAVRPVPADVR